MIIAQANATQKQKPWKGDIIKKNTQQNTTKPH